MRVVPAGVILASAVCLLTSCLTTTEKKIIDPPWRPAAETASNGISSKPPIGQIAPVFYSKDKIPAIDGSFDEWAGLDGVHTRVMVYGGLFNQANTDSLFVVRTDGINLYLYADVTDDSPNANALPAPQAWRGDSIEFFFGTDTMYHTFYKNTDKRIRIVPKSKTNKFSYDVSINDVSIQNDEIKVAIAFSETGYKVEACVPLSQMNVKSLKIGQKVRLECQINDADFGKERSRLLHWMSQKDVSYMDASTWGDGKVVALVDSAQAGEK